mmetsp:Transcript_9885/g.14723  ORF Transcript_9885/g.14723 Transcript_9885/m.14723 type:complete len:137 (-) Transcript_9885:322-732(-)
MGSQQSTNVAPPPNPTTDERIANETIDKSIPNNEPTPVSKRKKKIPPNLQGFALVEYKCRKKKRAYDICSNTKHKSFVAGLEYKNEDGDEQSCEDLFDSYKECILKGMMKDREKRGLKPPTEESALGVFAEYADEE